MRGRVQVLVDAWNPGDSGSGALAARLVDSLAARNVPAEVLFGRAADARRPNVDHRVLGGSSRGFERAIARELQAGRLGLPIMFRGLGPLGGVLVAYDGLEADRGAERPIPGQARANERAAVGCERAWFETAPDDAVVVAPSHAVAAAIGRCYPKFRGEVVVQHPRLRVEHYRPPTGAERGAARTVLGLRDGEPTILWLGHDEERGGCQLTLDVLAHLRARGCEARLIVAGSRCRSRLPSHSDVISVGPIRDRRSLLHAADLVLRPSSIAHGDDAVAQALATGIPVVTTPYDAGAELVDAVSMGHSVRNPFDVEALARACRAQLIIGHAPARRSHRRETAVGRISGGLTDAILGRLDRAIAS